MLQPKGDSNQQLAGIWGVPKARHSQCTDGPHGRKYTVGNLFAGMGGFCRAFEAVGFKALWANESDIHAVKTYHHNFPAVKILHKNIEDLSPSRDNLEPVDVLTAGFPCQSFSVAGDKSGFNDPRGQLFFEVARILRESGVRRPKIVVLENVKHLLKHDGGKTFARVVTEVQRAGYWFRLGNVAVLNTRTHTRIPQNRERLYMVAMNWDVFRRNEFAFPKPEDGLDSLETFLDLDMRADDDLYFDERSKYGRMFIDKMAEGNATSVYVLRRCYVRENKSNSVFTLTAIMGDGGHNVPVIRDKWGIRKLTPRECARLQGFANDFFFPDDVSRTQRYKQIGNAVTVPLAAKIAFECKRQLAELIDCRRRPE
jgi:DNA (cytosine-5)-methyltransferase 1